MGSGELMGGFDRHMSNELDRWLTTDPRENDDQGDEWFGCPQRMCCFEGTRKAVDAHVSEGEHLEDET